MSYRSTRLQISVHPGAHVTRPPIVHDDGRAPFPIILAKPPQSREARRKTRRWGHLDKARLNSDKVIALPLSRQPLNMSLSA